jgi:aspartokinase/homoserine dehydrogenase 1
VCNHQPTTDTTDRRPPTTDTTDTTNHRPPFQDGGRRRSASKAGPDEAGRACKALSNVDGLALFNLEGMGMVGVHGMAAKLFATLEKVNVNVIFIAQASSEHSICFAVPGDSAEATREAVERAFYREIAECDIHSVDFVRPVSIVCAVGEEMMDTAGVAGLFFGAFTDSRVNVLAISQGSSQRNISAVVHTKDVDAAMNAIHSAMCEAANGAAGCTPRRGAK